MELNCNKEWDSSIFKALSLKMEDYMLKLGTLLKKGNVLDEAAWTSPQHHIYLWTLTLTYQCQTWPLTKKLVRKVTINAMKAANKIKMDRISDESIRNMVGTVLVLRHVKQLRMADSVEWFGHHDLNQSSTRTSNQSISRCTAGGRSRRRRIDWVAQHHIYAGQLTRDKRLYLPQKPSLIQADG